MLQCFIMDNNSSLLLFFLQGNKKKYTCKLKIVSNTNSDGLEHKHTFYICIAYIRTNRMQTHIET